jgi:hypothetical protein
VAALRVQACVPVASVPAPAVHAEAVPAAKSTRADGESMVVGEQSESGSRRGQNGVTSCAYAEITGSRIRWFHEWIRTLEFGHHW